PGDDPGPLGGGDVRPARGDAPLRRGRCGARPVPTAARRGRVPMTDLDQIVDAVLARHPLAGLSIGVVSRDGLGATAMRGVAGADRPVDIDTVFRIGSVTKTLTALALVRLY